MPGTRPVPPAPGPVPAMCDAVCDAVDAACLAWLAAADTWLRALDAKRGEGASDLDDLPAGGVSDEFRRGAAFAELCRHQADADRRDARAAQDLDVWITMDRLAEAVDALAAERDELRERIARAVFELNEAPDIDPDKASKRAVLEVLRANTFAWHVLAEGRDPPSRQSKGFPGHSPLSKGPISEAHSAQAAGDGA